MDIEEDIKIVKEFNEKNRFRDCGRLNNAIEHILAKIEELKILEDDLKDKRIVYVDTPEFEEEFIPKQKVKEIFDRLHISDIEPWSTYKVSGDILFDI